MEAEWPTFDQDFFPLGTNNNIYTSQIQVRVHVCPCARVPVSVCTRVVRHQPPKGTEYQRGTLVTACWPHADDALTTC